MTQVHARAAYSEVGAALFQLLREIEGSSWVLLSQTPVSHARLALLRSLALDGPSSSSEIARARGVARQGVHRVARLLEAEGLVRTRRDPRHGRRRVLELTERGAAEYRELTAREARELNALARGFRAEELRETSRLLHLLAERTRDTRAPASATQGADRSRERTP